MAPTKLSAKERRERILLAGSVRQVLAQPDGRELLEAESKYKDSERRLITPEQFENLRRLVREADADRQRFGAFFDTDDVIIVPGFLGSTLSDTAPRGHGLIWIDPQLVLDRDGVQLSSLALGAFNSENERPKSQKVQIVANRPLPIIYDLLHLDLAIHGYSVTFAPFDWRKNMEESARSLAEILRARLGRRDDRPLHLIAHSQGSLVARRALQILGARTARQLVRHLVLLGPASYGTFSAAFALAGNHEMLELFQRFYVAIPDNFTTTLQTFTGLYQLLPWKQEDSFNPKDLKKKDFWKSGVDSKRLGKCFGWAEDINTEFFNDRTAIILGSAEQTVDGVAWDLNTLAPTSTTPSGDGTVLDCWARLPGVRTFRALKAPHATMAMDSTVRRAVRDLLMDRTPRLQSTAPALRGEANGDTVLNLASIETPKAQPTKLDSYTLRPRPKPPAPPARRLRVFSFDPLLAQRLDSLDIAELTMAVKWEDSNHLSEGPVGEYVEVVDYDPANNVFYHPVDLCDSTLVAQDGLTPEVSNPQFHQQMVYAVSMATIEVFEQALGRVALWAPHLEKSTDENGQEVFAAPEEQYVPRLRVYPHALRKANAYYDPSKHALLFGYFDSRDLPGGETLPGGTTFTCLSYDIVAHETAHALLHGLHRYLLDPSNPDVLAFHEAFADIVALLQHFGHREVLRRQIAISRGDLNKQGLLGQLAQEFGSALHAKRGALRRYLGHTDENGAFVPTQPDPTAYSRTTEPHDLGAILVAAIFNAFLNVYRLRSRDLYRLATNGTGVLPEGEISHDLVNRLAAEAAQSAQYVLQMCIRALDYIPPVDLTFGEYLRALVTADYDMVGPRNRDYRVAVIDAFRQWGIYPHGVSTLDEQALLWQPAYEEAAINTKQLLAGLPFQDWNRRADRRQIFLDSHRTCVEMRRWLYANARLLESHDRLSMGVCIVPNPDNPMHSIPRNRNNVPKFQVYSVRPCSRVGSDGQQRIDLVAQVVQRRAGYFDPQKQKEVDAGPPATAGAKRAKSWAFSKDDNGRPPVPYRPDFWFRGGCTAIIDPETGQVRYFVRKGIDSERRLTQQRQFALAGSVPSLAATYLAHLENRHAYFALLHAAEEWQ